ncbi:MAG: acetyl-CoA carboxylase biotin carboxyl carrier protein [Novosphingobium sp.]
MTTPRPDDDLEALVRQFQASDLTEMHVRTDGIELFLSRNPDAEPLLGATIAAPATSIPAPAAAAPRTTQSAASAPAPSPAPAPAAANIPDGWSIVSAPYLGTFYRAPKPGEANFVELGQSVDAGTDLCLVEVMKLFTAVCADVKGVVRHIYVNDGDMVVEGQPLFALEPAA